jgi:6-phosphogluconolactonase
MKNNLHIFKTPEELAEQFAVELMNQIANFSGRDFHLAISGGKTPDLLFSVLAKKYSDSALWQKVHFWWVDERMVPPDNPESNFGNAEKLLFSQICIPEENIHRIKGENNSETEEIEYSEEIQQSLSLQDNWPVFDLILLGMGDDGHTASIFPNHMELLNSERICEITFHPLSEQKRITLTGKVINYANKVCFLVTGANKADRISEIWAHQEKAKLLPASHIHPVSDDLSWFLDESAAQFIR